MTKGKMKNDELKRFLPIAKMIGQTFGKNCEVVLHDLTMPKSSVVFVMNNHVTGRQIGQSFDHLITEVLLSPSLKNDQRCNYTFTLENGKKIKSSTVLIRNNADKAIGALCINIDITAIEASMDLLYSFIKPESDLFESGVDIEDISGVSDVFNDLLDRIISMSGEKRVTKKERLNLIEFMDTKGVFLVKGAVEKVAEKMGISAVTVYSYLDEIRRKNMPETRLKL
ncbi:helix-turn-helix transcriptional regulator [Treponema sp. OMZ 840]|uniref:helix-turn-helix transcriptional regulator n=1 Tax=Treponema sp. OMZ 840 TaxID=244313 RepID=UPI003D9492AF